MSKILKLLLTSGDNMTKDTFIKLLKEYDWEKNSIYSTYNFLLYMLNQCPHIVDEEILASIKKEQKGNHD